MGAPAGTSFGVLVEWTEEADEGREALDAELQPVCREESLSVPGIVTASMRLAAQYGEKLNWMREALATSFDLVDEQRASFRRQSHSAEWI
jgi:hypothetical protein